ncbi:MAG: hypothetical protein K0A94_04355 [Desulfuromonadales bacterium]|nr:hypothetical protein [Desulfuromonadales bacterium]
MTAAVAMSAMSLVGAGIALIAILFQRKTLRRLAQQIKDLETNLIESLQELKSVAPVMSSFSAHLHDAETIQQKSHQELKEKLQANNAVQPQMQADKYRYAVALAAQGQSVDNIAQALNMASAEVEQVVLLAQVKRPV